VSQLSALLNDFVDSFPSKKESTLNFQDVFQVSQGAFVGFLFCILFIWLIYLFGMCLFVILEYPFGVKCLSGLLNWTLFFMNFKKGKHFICVLHAKFKLRLQANCQSANSDTLVISSSNAMKLHIEVECLFEIRWIQKYCIIKKCPTKWYALNTLIEVQVSDSLIWHFLNRFSYKF